MKIKLNSVLARSRGFTLVEIMVSLTVVVTVLSMCMTTFVYGLRIMYKDSERLKSNASLRSFMAQVSKETMDASYFYLFPYYTAIDANVNLSTDVVQLQLIDAAGDDYDKWVGHGDCLVLVTKTSEYRDTDIRQIRIYYRVIQNQAERNTETELRYYETADWGEGPVDDNNDATVETNGHTSVAAELNLINLLSNPRPTGNNTKLLSLRTKGRAVPAPYLPYAANDRYPMFSAEAADSISTNSFVSINIEFINGSNINSLLSSSSFNYTISPRR